MATQDEIRAQQQGIQNSETLLDLSNQLNNSITERRKLLKNISEEEQQYFATVKQQQKLSMDIAANAEKYLGFQIKSKDLSKQIIAVEDNIAKSKFTFLNIENKLNNDRVKAISKIKDLYQKEIAQKQDINNLDGQISQKISQRNAAELRGNRDLADQLSQEIKEETKVLQNKEKSLQKILQQKEAQINLSNVTKEQIKNGKKALEAQEKEIAFLRENLRIRKQIENSTGLLGGMAKAASKIPGIGQYLKADEAIDEMEKLAAEIEKGGGKATSFGNRMLIAGRGLSTLAKGAYENLKSPEAIFTFIFTQANKANKQVVEIGKSFGVSYKVANQLREEFVSYSRSASDTFVTTDRLVKAQSELSQQLGIAVKFSNQEAETFSRLTELVGLSADEAGKLVKFSAAAGVSTKDYEGSLLKGAFAAQQTTKSHFSGKEILQDVAKLSAGILVKFQGNPVALGKAVAQAKALGLTLEQVDKVGESLLNFESSIENELKAELITGRQLNLEKARYVALTGDQAELSKEIAEQAGSLEDFQNMNVIQQKSLAEAFGMSKDEMADMLMKQEMINTFGDEASKLNKEQLIDFQKQNKEKGIGLAEYLQKQTEQQDAQDKFNNAIIKLQDLFGNLVAGPLGGFLDMLTGALNIVNYIGKALSFLATPLQVVAGLWLTIKTVQLALLGIQKVSATYEAAKVGYAGAQVSMATGYNAALLIRKSLLAGELAKTIAIAAAWAVANPIKALVGLGVAAAVSAGLYSMLKGDDVLSEGGYGKRTLLSPEGAIKLNDKDTVIAGTNLGDGDGVAVGPNINRSTLSPSLDLSPITNAINVLSGKMETLMSKQQPTPQFTLQVDGKAIGTAIGKQIETGTAQSQYTSYKVA